ncbi:MAG: phytanoyl-CoA dioxygenase family protein [Candidatus Latescibacteria bacterium]|nr:phytanoyl-CoA dioxygenase family protein [Candidatus Latescibacterota bacterium]
MPILSEQDRMFWEKNGYVVIHNAVPQENLDAVIEVIWEFLGMDPDDPDDWYREPHRKGGMVEMYHHQALWNNRQYPRVYQAFTEIWREEKLWVSIDRANMKPPVRTDKPEWDHKGMIHWDIDTSVRPVPFMVQGVLYLTDTAENQGGFQCVPGFHRKFEEWGQSQSEDSASPPPDPTGLEVQKIPGKAGDLVIWQSLLPHGNSRNTSDRPRLAQYITMFPTGEKNEEARQSRIRLWRDRLSPDGFPGDPRGLEQQYGKPATLTALGKKLLGLEVWDPV